MAVVLGVPVAIVLEVGMVAVTHRLVTAGCFVMHVSVFALVLLVAF